MFEGLNLIVMFDKCTVLYAFYPCILFPHLNVHEYNNSEYIFEGGPDGMM